MAKGREINKVMLISPKYTLFKSDVRRNITPMGLAYLGAFLERENYDVSILDIFSEGYHNLKKQGDFVICGLDDEEIKKRIKEFKPDVAGVSCIFSTQYKNVQHTLKLIKEVDENITTLIGGSHPTYTLEETLNNNFLDFTIIGEGELPTLQLLNALNNKKDLSTIGGLAYRKGNKKLINNKLQYMENLNDLPLPARHLLNMEQYFKINMPQNPYPLGKRVTQIITSRGCSAKCIFCTTTNFWGNRYRGRSAENVVDEIRKLKKEYDIDEFQITDDNITLNKKRVMKILYGIKDLGLKWCVPQGVAVWALDNELLEKMKESGCYQLTFAIESGNQNVLNNIVKKPLRLKRVKPLVKKAQELDIQVHAFAICGLPGETIEQMHQTYDFVKDCNFDSASFFVATPLVGSELLKICNEKGYLREGIQPNEQLYKIGNITTPDFEARQVQELTEHFSRLYNETNPKNKRFGENLY